MAFGQNEMVAVLPFGVRGIVPHHVHEQRDHDFDRRKRSAGMAGFRIRDHFDDFAAHAFAEGGEFGDIARSLHVFLL